MRALLLVLLLPVSAQAASVLLVPEDPASRALAGELLDAFTAQKLVVKTAPPGSPAMTCLSKGDERDACLANIGEKAKVVGVFVVSGGLKGSKGTLTLELLVNGAVVKKETTKVSKGKVKQQMKGPLWQLIKLLPKGEASAPVEGAKVTVTEKPEPEPVKPEPEPEPVKPEPVVTKPEPEPVKPEPVVVKDDAPKKDDSKLTPRQKVDDDLDLRTPAPKSTKPKVAAWVATVVTIAAAGTAATFGGLGLAGKGRLESAPNGQSELTYQEAVTLQQTSNTELTIALGAGIGAGVGAVVTGILWGVD